MTPEEVTHEVRRLEITTRHLVRDIVAGEYSSAFRGRGVEFAEVREYQPGDDIRTIDWNVTARLGSAYVKRYLEERELTVVFVVDRSASGGFGSRVRTKGDLATEVVRRARLRGRPQQRSRRPDARRPTGSSPTPSRARGGDTRSGSISELLAFTPEGRGTDLGVALATLESSLHRRAVIFLVSDFLATGYEPALARLARRHDLVAIQIVDPRERELPDVGLVTLWDPESGDWRVVDTADREVRRRFSERATAFDRGLERMLMERGADRLQLETGRAYAEPLLAFFRRRERMLWR